MSALFPRRDRFELPDGVVYLDGNSLGPLPLGVAERAMATIRDEWGGELIRAWNSAGWMDAPRRVGDKLAPIIGAPAGSVVVGDTLSIKVVQAVAAGCRLRPGRTTVLSDTGNFPSDLYVTRSLLDQLDGEHRLLTVDPEQVADHLDDEVAVLLLTEVDYRTGRRHDMAALTEAAHAVGAIVVWDLAHSAGAVPLDVAGCGVDLAVGCTYKYLNGGPGAPAFIHVRPDLVDEVEPLLAGWLGHAAPFAMESTYRPGAGIERLRVGTPPVVQMAMLDHALDLWVDTDVAALHAASIELSEQLIAEVGRRCPQLTLVSPKDPDGRGSHVSFAAPMAEQIMQALIDRDVIGDVRPPSLLRFGITPLYLDAGDITAAVDALADIFETDAQHDPKYAAARAVT